MKNWLFLFFLFSFTSCCIGLPSSKTCLERCLDSAMRVWESVRLPWRPFGCAKRLAALASEKCRRTRFSFNETFSCLLSVLFFFFPVSVRSSRWFFCSAFVCLCSSRAAEPTAPKTSTTYDLNAASLQSIPLPGTRACVFERIPLEKCCSNIWLLMCPVLYFSAFKPTSNMMK